VRTLVNRLFYPEEVDPGTLLGGHARDDLVAARTSTEVVAADGEGTLRDSLRLEAVLVSRTNRETVR